MWVFGPPIIRFRDTESCIGYVKWWFESLESAFGTRKFVLGPRCCDVSCLQAEFGSLKRVFGSRKIVLGPRSCELGSRQAVCGALNRVFGSPTMVLGLRCCDFGRLQAEVGALKRVFGSRKHVLGPTLGGSFRLKPRMRECGFSDRQ